MNFSQQFIKILDAMCDKVGVAIDWGNANILPHVQELATKVVHYEIVTSCIWLVLYLLLAYLCYRWTKWMWNYECEDLCVICIFSTIFMIGFLIGGVKEIFDIATAFVLPEKTIIQFGIDLKNSLGI